MQDDSYYEKLGFMCGLEIHQRLATERKLFCSCPAHLSDDAEPEKSIVRYQRAVAGELGEIDRSAKFEALKNRKFMYKIDDEHACLVDIDEEPPHIMNDEALGTALSISSALKMRIFDELQPMRKEVVDGSNPSAFQRTTKVGVDGILEVGKRKINITSIFIEEESAGIEKSGQLETIYKTDRIGIPLIEIDTDPYIKSPKEAKDIALGIGTLLRISGKVQRGIGSIRQDVNVSIRGGARVEIKGLQELDTLDKFVENEVERQHALIKIKEELHKRKGVEVGEEKDVTGLFKGSKAKIIHNALEKGGVVIGFGLSGFAGFLGREVNPGRRLGTEISEYAKMGGVNGIIHSDENLEGYEITKEEIAHVRKAIGATKETDAFVLIAGDEVQVRKAIGFAVGRAKYALEGVPLETRAVVNNNDACVTRFMRPLPGGSRMYPETDALPVPITREMMAKADENAPSLDKLRSKLMTELKNAPLVEQLLLSPRLQMYRAITAKSKAEQVFVANTLLQKFTELKRNGFDVDSIDDELLVDLFRAFADGELTKNAVEEVLKELAKKKESLAAVVKRRGLKRITGKELHALLQKEFKDKNGSELVREVMSKYRLNVDGEELNAFARKKTG